jgi:hypothetical protein
MNEFTSSIVYVEARLDAQGFPREHGATGMLKLIIIAAVVVCSVAHAQILIWWNYSEWERLPQDAKVAYLAGAFDSLVGLADDQMQIQMALHYSKCVSGTHMSPRQLTDGVSAFGAAHPELRGFTVQRVLVNYLISLCGTPPQR